MVEMSIVIHEKGCVPRPVAPAKPSPIPGPGPRRHDAVLCDAAERRKVVVVAIHWFPRRSRRTRDSDGVDMQIIGAGDARIKGAQSAPIPVIADVVIDALVPLVAPVHRAAVIEPIEQSLGGGWDRIVGLAERF